MTKPTNLPSPIQGVLDIYLIQGDDLPIQLEFMTETQTSDPNDPESEPVKVETPIDLNTYSDIVMDVKEEVNIQAAPRIRYSIEKGNIEIVGTDQNVLRISISSSDFACFRSSKLAYDIKFVKDAKTTHYIKGTIHISYSTTA